jgi:hypothetical protein
LRAPSGHEPNNRKDVAVADAVNHHVNV